MGPLSWIPDFPTLILYHLHPYFLLPSCWNDGFLEMTLQPDLVYNVPPEIWGEIFLHARRPRVFEANYVETRFTRYEVSITVSQVCNRFRKIAISTPRLWSTIVLNFAPRDNHRCCFCASGRMNLWLERSKNTPLSVFLYNIRDWDIDQDSNKKECLLILLSNLRRWKEAVLDWEDTNLKLWSLFRAAIPAPLLESLYLKAVITGKLRKVISFPSLLWSDSRARRLERLEVKVIPMMDEPEDMEDSTPTSLTWTMSNEIPYKQLTHLRFAVDSVQLISRKEILLILQCAQNLVCCFIGEIGSAHEPLFGHPLAPIDLPHLRHLYLEERCRADMEYQISASQLLDYITAPSMSSLTLYMARSQNWKLTSIENFLHRSCCSLVELNLSGVDLEDHEFLSLLNLTSASLRRLHLDRLPIGYEFERFLVERLTHWDFTASEYTLCPNLERVSFSPTPSSFNDLGNPLWFLTPILRARLFPPAGGTKKFKTLLVPAYSSERMLGELRNLCKDPTDFTIGFNHTLLDTQLLWRRLAYE